VRSSALNLVSARRLISLNFGAAEGPYGKSLVFGFLQWLRRHVCQYVFGMAFAIAFGIEGFAYLILIIQASFILIPFVIILFVLPAVL
jgi:hypothetical protein